ncbi:aldo/keto reductase [Segetibacter koreensis]|uniref:aldo/keto reductase n=1 Tax=Segetibacter koreensis TaxID=398037 RepID=UPI0003636F4F|nr:aldo/keto reductase [Segetibacter koreensis]
MNSSTSNTISKKITVGKDSGSPLEVYRMGYGTMRLTGEGIWGEPANRDEAIQVLRKAVDEGVNFIDTADYYGPDVTNRLIVEALYPYSSDLVICTKVGAKRAADKSWPVFTRPEELRQSIDNNLKQLKLEQLPVVHFRMSTHNNPVPFAESVDAMFQLQREGKILHVGLSNVTDAELQWGLKHGKIATVQNMYSFTQRTTAKLPIGETRGGEEVLKTCEENSIPLIPFFSLITSLPQAVEKIEKVAQKHAASKAQINLAWLLHKSPWILPIPGTSSLNHLKENLEAITILLDEEDLAMLQ